jgi:hypothetical protein
LNRRLLEAGATVYALVTPETEAAKAAVLGNAASAKAVDQARDAHLEQFRDAWTGKQEQFHKVFFDTSHRWSLPFIELNRETFKFTYPTAGASEPLRHLIYGYGNRRQSISQNVVGQIEQASGYHGHDVCRGDSEGSFGKIRRFGALCPQRGFQPVEAFRSLSLSRTITKA